MVKEEKDIKPCPYCGEIIAVKAKVCKYCRMEVENSQDNKHAGSVIGAIVKKLKAQWLK